MLAALPADLNAAFLVVQHLDPVHPSHLAEIMDRRTALKTTQAHHGDPIEPGTVYFAVPDRHLLVSPECTITLTESPVVHFVRPAADLLFGSIAEVYGARAIVVVLSGGGTDGAEGAVEVSSAGGTVIAQNEQTSEFWSMPRSAIETGRVDHVLPLQAIAGCIEELLAERGDAS